MKRLVLIIHTYIYLYFSLSCSRSSKTKHRLALGVVFSLESSYLILSLTAEYDDVI